MKKFYFILIFFSTINLFSNKNLLTREQYVINKWQMEDGLPQNSVNTIIQTKEGYIWFGTQGGLVRFDGVDFKIFDKSNVKEFENDFIRTLFEDEEKNLYIGTNGGGLLIYKDGSFLRANKEFNFNGKYVYSIFSEKIKLWIGSDAGLTLIEDGKIKSEFKNEKFNNGWIRCIHKDSFGILWVGTTKGLFFMKDGKILNLDFFADVRVYAISSEKDYLFLATDKGFYKIFMPLDKERKITQIVKERTWCFLKEKDGLWLGTLNGLLFWENEKLSKIEGLPDENILSLHIDNENNLWVGTDAGGIAKLNRSKVNFFGINEGLLNEKVRVVYEDRDKNFYIGTDNGLHIIKDGKIKILTKKNGLSSEKINSIFQDSYGRIWVGTYGAGLNLIFKDSIKIYDTSNGLCHNVISDIKEGKGREIWIGTAGGLNLIKDNKIEKFTEENGLASNTIVCMLVSQDNSLYIGTYGGGLSIYRNGNFKNFSSKDGLPNDKIVSLYEDKDGTIWIGTLGGGLIKFKDDKIIKIISKKDGLINDNILQILEDDENRIWIGSYKGVFYFSKENIHNIKCKTFSKEDGMRTLECNGGSNPSSFKTSSGLFCFSTIKGLAIFNPSIKYIDDMDFPILIEDFFVDDKKENLKKEIIIKPGKHNVKIKFTALKFKNSKDILFKYRLKGFSDLWSEPETRRVAIFEKIGKGKYTFELMAGGIDGMWNEKIESLEFTVKPLFYETPFFYILCIFSFIFLIFSAYLLRMNRIKLKMKHLQEIAEERRKVAEHLSYIAHYDLLTGLPNRLSLIEKMEDNIKYQKPFTLFVLNLYRFREIVDILGRDGADLVLKELSKILFSFFSDRAFISRLERDEFALVFENLKENKKIAQEIMEKILKPIFISGKQIFLKSYIGGSRFPINGNDPETLIKNANFALEMARMEGPQNYEMISAEKSDEFIKKIKLKEEIIDGLKYGQFFLHFQPMIEIKNEKIFGIETLIRWNHPVYGIIPPLEFLPVA